MYFCKKKKKLIENKKNNSIKQKMKCFKKFKKSLTTFCNSMVELRILNYVCFSWQHWTVWVEPLQPVMFMLRSFVLQYLWLFTWNVNNYLH